MDAERIAERVARRLFTSGAGVATRVVLVGESHTGDAEVTGARDLGGWSERAARQAIHAILREELAETDAPCELTDAEWDERVLTAVDGGWDAKHGALVAARRQRDAALERVARLEEQIIAIINGTVRSEECADAILALFPDQGPWERLPELEHTCQHGMTCSGDSYPEHTRAIMLNAGWKATNEKMERLLADFRWLAGCFFSECLEDQPRYRGSLSNEQWREHVAPWLAPSGVCEVCARNETSSGAEEGCSCSCHGAPKEEPR